MDLSTAVDVFSFSFLSINLLSITSGKRSEKLALLIII